MSFSLATLKVSASALAMAAVFAASQAGAATIATLDISGVTVDAPLTTTVNLNGVGAGTVTDIAFDFDVEVFGIAWGSEVRIDIVAPSGEIFDFSGSTDFGFGTSAGVFSFDDSFSVVPEPAAGDWLFNFTASFNDDSGPEHSYLAGSSISLLNSTPTVPLPAGMVLGLTGLAAFGAAGARRRQKPKSA